MSDRSAIEWTDATWNPIRARGELGRHFCLKLSEGCANCYASAFNRRMGGATYPDANTDALAVARQLVAQGDIYLDEQALTLPMRWAKPRRIFVGSMTDLFGEWVPEDWLCRIFGVMTDASEHTFQVLTKRPNRMRAFLAQYREIWPRPNVWLGVSVELDRYAWRAKVLAEIPAAVRFVSAEPLLGPLPSLPLEQDCKWCKGLGFDTSFHLDDRAAPVRGDCPYCKGTGRALQWLIVGGESGPGARPMHPDWARDLRDRAQAAGVALHFKQWGEWLPSDQRDHTGQEACSLKGATHSLPEWRTTDGRQANYAVRVGKHRAGRLLDGQEYSEFPRVVVPA
jgi:protein gp37